MNIQAEEGIRILLVEDNPGDVRLIREALSEVPRSHIQMDHVDCLKAAQEALTREEHDLVLLDLSLPDSQGLETVEKIEPLLRAQLVGSKKWRATAVRDQVSPPERKCVELSNLTPSLSAYDALLESEVACVG